MKMDDKKPEGAHDAGRDHRRAALPAYELGIFAGSFAQLWLC
jgi:hypothetical protein